MNGGGGSGRTVITTFTGSGEFVKDMKK